MKLKLALLFSLSIGANLFSYPVRLHRLYNPETNVCVDVISDPEPLARRYPDHGGDGLDPLIALFADLQGGGEVNFIWECSRQEAAAIQKDDEKLKGVFLNLQKGFTANVRQLLLREDMERMLPNEEMRSFCRTIVDAPSLAFNGLAKTIYPGEDLSWYSSFLYISGEQKNIYHHLPLKCNTQIDNLLQKQELTKGFNADLSPISNLLGRDFVCSDNVCQGAINLKECLAQLNHLLYVGWNREHRDYINGYTYRQWVMAVKIVLIQLLVADFAIFRSNTLNLLTKMEFDIQNPAFSTKVCNFDRLGRESVDEIISKISNFWDADGIEHSLPIAYSIFDIVNQLANSILELELTGNILTCDKKRIVVYVNDDTAQRLCSDFKCYGFVNCASVCCDPNCSTSYLCDGIWRWTTMVNLDQFNKFLFFETPKETYAKYQRSWWQCQIL